MRDRVLSTGEPSTPASYRNLAAVVFGPDSKAVKFLDTKIANDRDGAGAVVIVDETQVIQVLISIERGLELP